MISFTAAQASPVVQRVVQGDIVPYTGWCFNDVAMAKIIADKEAEDQRCQLKLDMQRDLINAKYNLQVRNLDLRVQSLELRVQSSESSVRSSEFGVQSSEFRIRSLLYLSVFYLISCFF